MAGISGKDQILKITSAPTYLGLANLFGDTINNYSATAIEKTTACFIPIDIFIDFIKNNGNFAFEIIKDISKQELRHYKQFSDHNQKQINGRVADTLLFFSQKIYRNTKFNLPLNRKEMSTFVCSSRETVIRELQSLANNKIISLKGKQIEILDNNRLEKISKNA